MAEFEASSDLGGSGNSYNDDDSTPSRSLKTNWKTLLIPLLGDIVAMLRMGKTFAGSAVNAPGTSATSTTSLTIGTGSKSLTLAQTGKAFALGQSVKIASTVGPTNWMAGDITAFNAETGALTVEVTNTSGAGTIDGWTVSLTAPGNFLPLGGGTLTGPVVLAGDAGSSLNPVTLQQMNATIAAARTAIGKRGRARAATTGDIVIASALNPGDAIDGVTLADGDLVLVKDQGAAEENGVYVAGAVPARSSEFDAYDDHPGSLIAVAEGTANADTLWICTSDEGGTLDTTAIAWGELPTSAGGWMLGTATKTGDYTVQAADKNRELLLNGTFNLTIDASTIGVGGLEVENISATDIVTLVGTVDGYSSNFKIYPGERRRIFSDGSALTSTVLKGFKVSFTSSGTWYPPPGYKAYPGIGWGAGAGGGNNSGTAAAGGGGYGSDFDLDAKYITPCSGVTITIGSGGAGGSSNNAGGDTTLGSLLTFRGGQGQSGGGLYASSQPQFSSGMPVHGGGFSATYSDSFYGGGRGATSSAVAGNTVFGGGGGGMQTNTTAGTSKFGGAGGLGVNSGAGNPGVAPGGGGGGTGSSNPTNGGDGARGQLDIGGRF